MRKRTLAWLRQLGARVDEWGVFTLMIGAVAVSLFLSSMAATRSQLLASKTFPDLQDTLSELAATQKQIEYIRAALTRPVTPTTELPEEIRRLESGVADINQRLRKLESALESSPEKALALPLIRKELDDQRNEITAIRTEIAHSYDFAKWFFGLIATMAVTMLIAYMRSTKVTSHT